MRLRLLRPRGRLEDTAALHNRRGECRFLLAGHRGRKTSRNGSPKRYGNKTVSELEANLLRQRCVRALSISPCAAPRCSLAQPQVHASRQHSPAAHRTTAQDNNNKSAAD